MCDMLTRLVIALNMKAMKLNQDQIRKFQTEGFLGPIRAFAASDIDAFLLKVSPILSGDEPSHHRHLDSKSVYRLCTSESIVGPIVSLPQYSSQRARGSSPRAKYAFEARRNMEEIQAITRIACKQLST